MRRGPCEPSCHCQFSGISPSLEGQGGAGGEGGGERGDTVILHCPGHLIRYTCVHKSRIVLSCSLRDMMIIILAVRCTEGVKIGAFLHTLSTRIDLFFLRKDSAGVQNSLTRDKSDSEL